MYSTTNIKHLLPVSTSSLADEDIIKGASGVDKDFQRKAEEMPRPLTEAPYYAIEVEPVIHHTMGGIKINSKAEVVDRSGKVIPSLYAAGEVTGGVHGGNRLGGNAVTDIIVFGKIAGASAVHSLGIR